MLKHILIPLDGSLLAERAFEPSKAILRPQGKIALVTAVHNGQVPVPESAEDQTDETPMAQLEAYLERVAMNLKLLGYDVGVVIREGDPAEVITNLAVRFGVEVIVMCTHGRSGLSRLFAGSVTTEVLNRTPCPVLVIPNRERERINEEAPQTDLGWAKST